MATRDNGARPTRSGTTTTDASGAPKVPTKTPAAAGRGGGKGRSGGVVDAGGKKHRKPLPTDPGVNIAISQAAKMRTAMTMVKTNRRRGRG